MGGFKENSKIGNDWLMKVEGWREGGPGRIKKIEGV